MTEQEDKTTLAISLKTKAKLLNLFEGKSVVWDKLISELADLGKKFKEGKLVEVKKSG